MTQIFSFQSLSGVPKYNLTTIPPILHEENFIQTREIYQEIGNGAGTITNKFCVGEREK